MWAEGQPERLTRNLSGALVGVSSSALDESAASQDREPLQRQSSSETNRNRVQENQRILAGQLLMYSLPVVGCILFLLLGVLIACCVIYVWGWIVIWHAENKPCDQPLKWWLLAMLLVPLLQLQLNSHVREAEQRPRKLQALVTPLGILIGLWFWLQCKTCAKTNPELFEYTKLYLVFQFVVWLLFFFASCGFVSFVFWLHRNGFMESGPGPAAAARPGLITEIETVRFDPALFTGDAAECPICQEEFVLDEPIKKTSCEHYFHETCLGQWLQNYAKSCPLCRQDLEEAADQHDCAA